MLFSAANLPYVIPAMVIALSIHEAMHAFVAHALGDTTAKEAGRLTLNPLKHIDIFTTILLPIVLILLTLPPIFIARPVPFNPNRVKFDEYGAALVGIAGPLTNFVLAALSAILLRVVNMPSIPTNFFFIFTVVNVEYFVLNMIPFPPLDGSRLLYAFAPEPLQKVMYRIESYGLYAILLFFLVLISFIGPGLTYLVNHVLHFLLGPIYAV